MKSVYHYELHSQTWRAATQKILIRPYNIHVIYDWSLNPISENKSVLIIKVFTIKKEGETLKLRRRGKHLNWWQHVLLLPCSYFLKPENFYQSFSFTLLPSQADYLNLVLLNLNLSLDIIEWHSYWKSSITWFAPYNEIIISSSHSKETAITCKLTMKIKLSWKVAHQDFWEFLRYTTKPFP